MCAVTRAKAWHRNAHNSLTVESKFVECAHADKQSQRGIQSATDTNDNILAVGMHQSFSQSCSLNIQDILAGGIHLVIGRNERMGIDFSGQIERHLRDVLGTDDSSMGVALGIDKRRIYMAISAQALNVNLCGLQLWLEGETLTLSQQLAVFENHGISAIDHVLRRFAKTAGGIDVAADGARTLLSNQRAQIGVLADELIAGREVDNDVSTSHCQVIAGRNWCPYILTDLYAKLDALIGLEHFRFGRYRNRCTSQINVCGIQILRGGKPALLVELIIVGQIGLRNNTQQRTALDDCRTVE